MSQLALWGDGMGSMTAQILIGKSHPNDGGIRPEWMVQVSENSRPRVILHDNINYLAKPNRKPVYYEWVPSVERGVEDILAMVALHVVKYKPLVDMLMRDCPYALESKVEIYEVPDEVRNSIYKTIKEIVGWPKLAISVYFKCYLESRFSILEDMDIDFELCRSVRVREKGGWGNIDLKRDVEDMVKV